MGLRGHLFQKISPSLKITLSTLKMSLILEQNVKIRLNSFGMSHKLKNKLNLMNPKLKSCVTMTNVR